MGYLYNQAKCMPDSWKLCRSLETLKVREFVWMGDRDYHTLVDHQYPF